MSCATRIRRNNENISIVVFEKGNNVSYASCGLPYFISGEIPSEHNLLIQTGLSCFFFTVCVFVYFFLVQQLTMVFQFILNFVIF
jgi:hypothetical protein